MLLLLLLLLMMMMMMMMIMLSDEARGDQVDMMLRESCFTRGLRHSNINVLIATCFPSSDQPLLVYRLLDEGNLKKFIQRCKISDVGLNQVGLL